MITVNKLKEAIQALFAQRPPKKELSSEKVREFVADYLSVTESDILLDDLKAALRETPFALAKTMLRGNSRLGWYFVVQSTPTVLKSVKKASSYKEKPLLQSQRLKR